MDTTAFEVLARLLRDNDMEVAQHHAAAGGFAGSQETMRYIDGLNAASARLRAAMATLPRPGVAEWRGEQAHGPSDKIIDADYATVDEPGHETWTMPKHIASP